LLSIPITYLEQFFSGDDICLELSQYPGQILRYYNLAPSSDTVLS
jgi:hypothetical protein